ncbi:uncharacterized protein TNCV_2579651 [Trichonephila clavipes]|uniref:Uncharacterized protein n=1 Tax=Trichonephila clavipes TaxID=2585209 RepID=A0A8X6SAR0_TRICX|nr:uncharacterized protein TNCV_2579651 [Trichonephila clavipes]
MDTFALLRLALSDNKIKSNFGGVYTSDTLTELRKHYRSFIVNTDPSHSRKRIFELSDNDEDDILFKPNTKRSKTTKSKFDLDLGCDAQEKKSIPPYSINLGKGVGMELKEFRGQYYVGLSKCSDSSNEVIRNRFNIPLAQLEVLKKACDAILSYVKDCT